MNDIKLIIFKLFYSQWIDCVKIFPPDFFSIVTIHILLQYTVYPENDENCEKQLFFFFDIETKKSNSWKGEHKAKRISDG